MIIFALTKKATDRAIERLRDVLRTDGARSDHHASGFYRLMRLQSNAIRVGEGEAIDSAARAEGLDSSVLTRWLKRR